MAKEIFRKVSLQRLRSPDELDTMLRVVDSRNWIALVTIGVILLVALLWSVFGVLPTTVCGQGFLIRKDATGATSTGSHGTIEALVYLTRHEGKRVVTGMPIRIAPTFVKREEYGAIWGRVTEVSQYPVTTNQVQRLLQNRVLTEEIMAKGAPIEVRAELFLDNTASGYRWTSSPGPNFTIDAGSSCEASITVEKRRPITLVIPFCKTLLGL